MREPRLVPTAAAREYLGGRHPAEFGVKPIGNGRGQLWDLKALDHALDMLAGITAPRLVSRTQAEEDDYEDELEKLSERIAAASVSRKNAQRDRRS